MTIHDRLAEFGVGLHDAEIHRVTVDYTQRTAEFDLEIWIQDDAVHGTDRDMYRPARLTFSGMEYCLIEPPDTRYRYDSAGSLRIDVDDVKDGVATYPAARSEGAFRCRIFVDCWNSFIAICATSVEVVWLGDAHDGPERLAEAP
jgi:hypothetical protein